MHCSQNKFDNTISLFMDQHLDLNISLITIHVYNGEIDELLLMVLLLVQHFTTQVYTAAITTNFQRFQHKWGLAQFEVEFIPLSMYGASTIRVLLVPFK